jgi:hypothetical protein
LWPYCLTVTAIGTVPALGLAGLTRLILTGLGVDGPALEPRSVGPSATEFVGLVLVAPLLETQLLGLMLKAFAPGPTGRISMAAVAGTLWGLIHAVTGPVVLLPIAWLFFVYACAYMAWLDISRKHALVAAAVPHALNNALAWLSLTWLSNGAWP